MADFGAGDIVRRHNGKMPMEVLDTRPSTQRAYARYCDGATYDPSRHSGKWFHYRDLVLITTRADVYRIPDFARRLTPAQKDRLCQQVGTAIDDNTHEMEDTIMPKLYQTKEETPRFGIRVGTNSAGLIVLEMKPSGVMELFTPKQVEEVKPYTVAIRFEGSSTIYHYLSRKGDVETGDFIIVNGGSGNIARVLDVDTKSDAAKVRLSGRKLVTAPFGESDGAVADVVDED